MKKLTLNEEKWLYNWLMYHQTKFFNKTTTENFEWCEKILNKLGNPFKK